MKKLNQSMIARLAAGEVAARNDGTLRELLDVLIAATSDTARGCVGRYGFYAVKGGVFYGCDETNLSSYPISAFFEDEAQPWRPANGEMVEACLNDNFWPLHEIRFIGMDDGLYVGKTKDGKYGSFIHCRPARKEVSAREAEKMLEGYGENVRIKESFVPPLV